MVLFILKHFVIHREPNFIGLSHGLLFSLQKLHLNISKDKNRSSWLHDNKKNSKKGKISIPTVQSIGKYGDKGTGESWNKIVTFAKSKRLFGMRTEFIGISHDDPDVTTPEKCRYDACITVTKNVEPDGEVGVKTIEGGKYAIFRLKGPYGKLSDAYRYIYLDWLPRSNVKTRNIPCFEKYLNNPGNTKPAKLLTEIYVPVE